LMQRLFLPEADLKSRLVSIRGAKARYLATVLRCRAGDPLFIHDDRGNAYSSVITNVTAREVTAELVEKIDMQTESALHVTLLQGLLKGEKMDLVVQKATELGVKEIVPVVTARSQVRETRKMARWMKIAEEASRQAGRNSVPLVRETIFFDKLDTMSIPEGIIFWEQGGDGLTDMLNRFRGRKGISLFTGPEGGFSEEEIRSAGEKGFVTATLGRRILRAETAAITAVAITQFALGDMGA
jgi:16S rRNA (uracil1498-N3)-methyltransferase